MKVVYEKPVMDVQCFMANEFCSTCGDVNKVYKFTCDAPRGEVYKETNGKQGLQTGWFGDEYLGGYKPCGETHEASKVDGEFFEGYVLHDKGEWIPETETINVMIWTGANHDNVHCTTKLNMDEWETAKS